MGLLERVATLIRADLDSLVSNSQDPKGALRQVVVDIQNQMMQLKTQVAVSAGEEKSLRQKQAECAAQVADWKRKAELAAARKDEHIARGAQERLTVAEREAAAADQQLTIQGAQLQKLRSALEKLDLKYREAQNLMRRVQDHPDQSRKRSAARSEVRISTNTHNEIEKIIAELKEKVSEG